MRLPAPAMLRSREVLEYDGEMSQRWIRIVVLGLASGCGTPGTPTATAAPASSVGTTPRVQAQGAAASSASGAIAGVPNADPIQKKKEREPSEPQAAPTVTTVLKGGSWFEDGHAGWVRLVVADVV
ncbi:MAG TPA: hypothetical protein VHO25_01120, partial [Polyangiaceae bacterium]|nr:hypothetical protein [Polyangiaceae bacterium]